jgi:hypothetical protein
MMKLSRLFVLLVVVMFMFVGCAKEPTQEISDAKAALEAAVQEGAKTYMPTEIEDLDNQLAAAVEAANNKTGKLFASNSEAKEKLLKIKADLETLKATIPAKKEEAKNNAITAQNEVKTALEEAKTLLANAPTGKGTQADIAAFNADIKALEDSMPELQKCIDGEDYFGASEKAKTIKEKSVSISDQIKQAIEKVAASKAKKPHK